MHAISTRRILTLILVGALVLSAGCSGIGIGGSDTDTTETGDAPATEDSPERGDETPTTDDASDESEAATDDSDADGTETGDGHDHDHGNATDSPAAGDVGELNSSSAESWGWATIVVDGQKLDLSERDESGDAVGVGGEKFIWLSATEGLTLADALSYFGVDADSSQVTVDGEQYSAADEGTSITYRVNGDPVDPEQYELGTRDEIWMDVETADTDAPFPQSSATSGPIPGRPTVPRR